MALTCSSPGRRVRAARTASNRSIHGLLGRRYRAAVERIRCESDQKRYHHERPENSSHQPNVLAPSVAVNPVMSPLTHYRPSGFQRFSPSDP